MLGWIDRLIGRRQKKFQMNDILEAASMDEWGTIKLTTQSSELSIEIVQVIRYLV